MIPKAIGAKNGKTKQAMDAKTDTMSIVSIMRQALKRKKAPKKQAIIVSL